MFGINLLNLDGYMGAKVMVLDANVFSSGPKFGSISKLYTAFVVFVDFVQ